MATIYDCDPNDLIEQAAAELKKVDAIKAPEWAPFVKTGMHKERPPVDKDWWYMRTASVLRKIYRQGPIGVSKLRVAYGGKKNRGMKTEHTYNGSGNIIRKVLQQLEKAGLVKQEAKGLHKGRSVTAAGKKFLDKIASSLAGAKPVAASKPSPAAKPAPAPENKPVAAPKPSPEAKPIPAPKPAAEPKPATEKKQEEVKKPAAA